MTDKRIIAIIKIGCKLTIQLSCSPNQSESPDSLKPFARANPPPKSKTICHGNLAVVSQSIKNLFEDFEGIKKSKTDIAIATVPSLM